MTAKLQLTAKLLNSHQHTAIFASPRHYNKQNQS